MSGRLQKFSQLVQDLSAEHDAAVAGLQDELWQSQCALAKAQRRLKDLEKQVQDQEARHQAYYPPPLFSLVAPLWPCNGFLSAFRLNDLKVSSPLLFCPPFAVTWRRRLRS